MLCGIPTQFYIMQESEEDEEDLEEFMRFIAAKQDLKLFQQQTSRQPSFHAATAANDISTAAHGQPEKDETMVSMRLEWPFIDSHSCDRNPYLTSETSKKHITFCLIQWHLVNSN